MWRGVACLLVVFYHATLIYCSLDSQPAALDSIIRAAQYGDFGVPMFFVISGFCIAATATNAHSKHIPVAEYFRRRFWRIYPPYWASLALLLAIFLIVDVVLFPRLLSTNPWPQWRPWWFSPSQIVGNVTLTESWRYHVTGGPRGHLMGQNWTLCYEEQFYFVVGLLLVFPKRAFFSLCGLVTLACIAVQQWAVAGGTNVQGFFFDGLWLLFAMGVVVFYALRELGWRGQTTIALGLVFGGFLVTWLPGLDSGWYPCAAIFAATLIGLHHVDEDIVRQRWLRPLSWCGTMCYSLYLVHQVIVAAISRKLMWMGITSPAMTLVLTVPLCLMASLLVGRGFYLTVEKRFLNGARRITSAEIASTAPSV